MKVRTGIGIDSHRFEGDRALILGGVTIEHDRGLVGHSDADVLTHAVIDALLGAAGLDDIGHHFSDTDVAYKDSDSLELLKTVIERVTVSGFEIGYIDTTVMMERPKISPYRNQIRERLGRTLGIDADDFNLKATTGEKLGFIGREEGVVALAVATLYKQN